MRSLLVRFAAVMSCLGPVEGSDASVTESVIFANVTDGYPVFRIPAVVRANDGTLLAFCEGRAGNSDGGNIDIVLKRSTDHGATWGPLILVQEEGGTAPVTIGNPAPVVDESTGHIHLLFCRENDTVFHTVSTDNGLTWSARTEITAAVKRSEWGWYATGPVHGIQLLRGTQAGRLVIPANHRVGADGSDSGNFGAQVLYSDDHGATWHMDALFEQANGAAPNETTLLELLPSAPAAGSRLYINSRDYGSDPGNRSEARSDDGGTSYSAAYDGNPHFVTPVCQGSLLRYSSTDRGDAKSRLLFSSPNGGSRSNGAIWISTDEAVSWSASKTIHAGDFAYSDLVRTADHHLGVICESTAPAAIRFLRANEAWLDEPPPPAENPGAAFWNFEEKPIGQTADLAAGALSDIDPADHRLNLTASQPFAYVAGAPAFGDGRALAFAGNGGASLADAVSDNRFDFGPDDSFTLEVVCRLPAGSTQTGALVAKDLGATSPSWWLRAQSGKARFLISDNATERFLSSSASINDGQWHHVAAVRDAVANKLRLYIDGVLSGEIDDTTTGSLANSQALWVGRFNASGSSLFTGEIDFVRISPAALAPAQFAGVKSQFDADGDRLPDTFERSHGGSLNTFGPGDRDGDGMDDLLEFALGTDPATGDAAAIAAAAGEGFAEVTTLQRLLPPWLGLMLESSGNLETWEDAAAIVTLTPASEGLVSRQDRLEFPEGRPDRLFFRYRLHDVK